MSLQVNNTRLGIPVRVIRKNKDKGSEFGSVYIYDGLYDVVRLSAGILLRSRGMHASNTIKLTPQHT